MTVECLRQDSAGNRRYSDGSVHHLLEVEERTESQWKVTVVVLLLLDAGSVEENENLDGFLGPVNLSDLLFNVCASRSVCVCWSLPTPPVRAGAQPACLPV